MSDISLDLYKVFYYICEFGSISKAANYLYVSQPAVTRKISELEDILEATLIYRTPRGIELTDYGKKLYNEIKDSIEKLNSVGGKFSKAQKEQNTVIRIDAGGYMTVKGLLLNVINQFSRKYPKIKYQISTLPFAEGFQKLKEGKIDIKLVSEKRIKDLPENIVIKNGYDVHSIFIINNEIKDRVPKKINLIDLNSYQTIFLEDFTDERKFLDRYFEENGKKFKPTFEVQNRWLSEEYVRLNKGIGITTKEYVYPFLKKGEYVEIETDIEFPKRTIKFALRKGSEDREIIKEFIKEANEYIKSLQ